MRRTVYLCNHDGEAVKGRRTSFAGAACPVARSLDVLGDPWSMLIVRDAFRGSRRFGDFQRGLGLARNILADRLRKLVAAGVLERRRASDGGGYDSYVLTERGEALRPVLRALAAWGDAHVPVGEPDAV